MTVSIHDLQATVDRLQKCRYPIVLRSNGGKHGVSLHPAAFGHDREDLTPLYPKRDLASWLDGFEAGTVKGEA